MVVVVVLAGVFKLEPSAFPKSLWKLMQDTFCGQASYSGPFSTSMLMLGRVKCDVTPYFSTALKLTRECPKSRG